MSRRVALALAAIGLLGATALAYVPPRDHLYRPPVGESPTRAEALETVDELLETILDAAADQDWIRKNIVPSPLPTGLDITSAKAYEHSLGPHGALRSALTSSEGPIATTVGPDYVRVVMEGKPHLSIVVRKQDGATVIDRFEATSCALCDERVRWVHDLLLDLKRRRKSTVRLLPGVELDVLQHLTENPKLSGQKFVGLMHWRNHQGGYVRDLLIDAQVVGAEGDRVHLLYANGTRDTWRVTYFGGRWRLDYSALPEESPLRMSLAELRQWRSPEKRREAAFDGWRPKWVRAADGAALRIGQRAIGADFDPADGTVLITVLDVDQVLSGVFRVDPETRQIVESWPVPPPEHRSGTPSHGWFYRYDTRLRPDGRELAMSRAGRIVVLDLDTGELETRIRKQYISTFDWVREDGGWALVLGSRWGHIDYFGATQKSAGVYGEILAIDTDGEEGVAITAEGRLVPFRFDEARPIEGPIELCCDGISDASVRDGREEILATCRPECGVTAERIPVYSGTPSSIPGVGAPKRGASFSPDGRWFTTGASGEDSGLLLWDALDDQPVAVIGDDPVHRVSWSSDGRSLLVLEDDGEVWLWDTTRIPRHRPGRTP